MSADSEPIINRARAPDDFTAVIVDGARNIQYKLVGLMLLIFILISSDIFINRVLANFEGAVNYKNPTSWGVCLQGLFLAIFMIIIDALIRQKII